MLTLLLLSLITPPDGGSALIDWILDQIKNGNYSLAVGGFIMLVVWASTHIPVIDDRIPVKLRGWVAVIGGVLAAGAANVFAGQSWGLAILHGLTAGTTAVAFWELIGQHFLPLNPSDASKIVVDTSKANDEKAEVVVGVPDPDPKKDDSVAPTQPPTV